MNSLSAQVCRIAQLLILCIVFIVVGCHTFSGSSSGAVVSSANNVQVPVLDQWPSYEEPNAQKFITDCEQDYKLALGMFNRLNLTSSTTSDLDVLNIINQIEIVLDRMGGRSSLFRNVHPIDEVRQAGDICQQKLMVLYSEISLSRELYNRISVINLLALDPLAKFYVQKLMKDFEQSGVNQDEKTRVQIKQINDEILSVGQQFRSNISHDVRTIEVPLSRLQGLPKDFIESHPVNDNGKVSITTNYPDLFPVSIYAVDDDLRKELHKANNSRAYPDNKKILKQLLEKRYELAQLLGYKNFAEYVTNDKMIVNPQNAKSFINKINRIAKVRAQQDYQTLFLRLKQINPEATVVEEWQKRYLENLIKKEVYDVDPRILRQYFSYKKVRSGIFKLVEEMFDVSIESWDGEVWHPSVEAYQMFETTAEGKVLIGQFYLDMHPRTGKFKHAAAFGIQEGVKGIQTPISALVCNFPGGSDASDLMEHTQVESFLHEFGHLLHGMFAGHQPWLSLSGISTERDFVEAPSQMLEEWVWDSKTLKTFATNANGEVIPDELIDKMIKAHKFSRGIDTRSQLFYASISLDFYNQNPKDVDLDEQMKALQKQYSPFNYVEGTHFYTSFGHLDGYSATYYTYMWSLVIATDMFSEFERHGLRNKAVAQRYRKYVLAPGGTKPAADLVSDFLRRPYSFDAFANQLKVGD